MSEQEFEESKKNPNNIKIIKKAISRYVKWFKRQQFPFLIDFPYKEELSAIGDIALWKALKSFNGRCKFSSWLFKITLQECSIEFQSRYRGQAHYIIEGDGPTVINNDFLKFENEEFVNNFIKKLNSTDANIMKMRFFNEMTLSDIGKEVKMSGECVRKRIKKNLKILREQLTKQI